MMFGYGYPPEYCMICQGECEIPSKNMSVWRDDTTQLEKDREYLDTLGAPA